jgi:hypothetical protein
MKLKEKKEAKIDFLKKKKNLHCLYKQWSCTKQAVLLVEIGMIVKLQFRKVIMHKNNGIYVILS